MVILVEPGKGRFCTVTSEYSSVQDESVDFCFEIYSVYLVVCTLIVSSIRIGSNKRGAAGLDLASLFLFLVIFHRMEP